MHQAILERTEENEEIIKNCKIRFIRSSSSALPPTIMVELEKKFNAPMIESYGMTEAAHQMTSNPLPPLKRKTGSVGLPSGPEVAIMDKLGIFLPKGKIGEIVIRGPSVIRGYENNPKANEKAFTKGWLRTGDQGYFDEDNYLIINGRIKEIINRGGEKIAPREIDEILLSHPNILQVVTFAFLHPKLGEDVAAAVVLQDNANITEWEIQKFVASRVADFKVPSHIIILDEIPKGPTGKIQRIGLAEKLGISAGNKETNSKLVYKAPRVPLEKKLVNIWSKVLKINRIGINDNFFQLGGDSIQAGQILSILRKLMQMDQIPLAIFLHAPTIEEMAHLISHEDFFVPPASLVAINKTGFKPRIFCVHACAGDVLFFTDLAHHLGPEQPFYALRAQGLEGNITPYDQIEDIATHYVKEIQAFQPEGPYRLGGAGIGGFIALEMAQQFLSQGKTVNLLVLMDTVLDSILPRLRYYLRRIPHYLIKRKLSELYILLIKIIFPKLIRKRRTLEVGIPQSNVFDGIKKAVNRYVPNTYPGRIILFMSERREGFPSNPQARIDPWLKIATGIFDNHVVPGEHMEIFNVPNVTVLSQKLSIYLNELSSEDTR